MAFLFNRKKLDVSTPSNFGKSLHENANDLEKLFDQKLWVEISKRGDARAYMEQIESFARAGNLKCQEFVSQLSIMGFGDETDSEKRKFYLRRTIEFGTMAAESESVREALNLPISLGRLLYILNEENDQFFTDETKYLSREMYRWSLKNSKNMAIPIKEREDAGETARGLYESMPELYDGIYA